MIKRRWLTEINVLRGLAMSAVILIHILNTPISNLPSQSIAYRGYYFFQMLIQFAVPCFIFISAVMVSYHLDDKQIKIKDYYKKKFMRIVIPYILWTIIYLGIQVILGNVVLDQFLSAKNWFMWIFFGKAYTHLYYLSVIIQFYLLVPIIIWLGRMLRNHFFIALCGSILFQVGVYWFNKLYFYSVFPYPATIYLWYWVISFMGIWIGFNYEKTMDWVKRNYLFLTSIFIASGGYYLVLLVRILNKVPISTFYYQMNYYLYVFAASLLLLWLAEKIDKRKKTMSKVFHWIGTFSFGIYLIHPLMTFVLNKLIHTTNSIVLLGIVGLSFVMITYTSGLIVKWMDQNVYVAVLLGKYPKKKDKINQIEYN